MKKLAPHQKYGSEMMDIMPSLAVFYEAGTGKTNTLLDYLYRRTALGGGPYLIICPKQAVSVWLTAIDELIGWQGYDADGIRALKDQCTVTTFARVGKRVNRRITLNPDLTHPWDVMAVDESQGLGNHSSLQTRSCLALSLSASRRYILTGTPISGSASRTKSDYAKLYGQMKFLEPTIWKNWTDFMRSAVIYTDPWGKPAAYREDYLKEVMESHSIVARLEDVRDMPGQIVQTVPVALSERKLYDDVDRGDTEKYGFMLRTGGSKYVKMLEAVSGFYKTDEEETVSCKTLKPDSLAMILEGTDDKVVVFCRFSHSIATAYETCAKYGKTVVYDGNSRDDAWKDFQYGDARFIVAQYQRGSQAINLQSSHTTVFFEPCLSALLLEQAMQRTYRTGQTVRCVYYWLVTEGTIEERVVNTVRSGVDVTRELMDRWAQENVLQPQ